VTTPRAWRAIIPAFLFAIFFAAANASILYRNPLNNDVSWYLYVGQALLAGKRLYVDIIETNPPLVCYLSEIPNILARFFGLSVKAAWVALTTAFVMGLCAFYPYVLGRRRELQNEATLVLLFLWTSCLACWFAFDFGQRDHLAYVASVAVMGLFYSRITAARRRPLVYVAIALVCGLPLAFKPFFLLPWFLCLIYETARLGWRKVAGFPETWIVPLLSLVQVLLILFVDPEFLSVARTITALYSVYNTASFGTLLLHPFVLSALAGTVLVFLYRPGEDFRVPIRLAGYSAAGWIISGLVQRKGWHYHLLPGVAAATFALFLAFLDFVRGMRTTIVYRYALRAAGALMICFVSYRSLRLYWDYPPKTRAMIPVVQRNAPGGSIIGFETGMFSFPLVNDTKVTFDAHYTCLWMLPGLYAEQVRRGGSGEVQFRKPSEMGPMERQMISYIYSDLARRPKLIIIAADKPQQGMGDMRFDIEKYLRQDPRIDQIMNDYEPIPFDKEYRVLRYSPETRGQKL
jgi:hypothetical protein